MAVAELVPEQVTATPRSNAPIAGKLRQAADILAAQQADPFRVAAYRRAADAILACPHDLADLLAKGGRDALETIPGIGTSIASAIAELLNTGRWGFLEHVRGAAEPGTLFRSVPGIGPKLARRVCDRLHIGTLEALEVAAHDDRLERIPGFGPRRAAMVRAALAEMLGRVRRSSVRSEEPPVELLLDVDSEHRRRAEMGELPKIAPKRFNPDREAWLPILHTVRDGWHFTAAFSNTARAHRLGRTGDWVVIYFHKDGWPEGQRTVVSERRGRLAGPRVVRGREAEYSSDRAVARAST
jgi:Holliday junction resolvasome RuvABC DNA-binding subunit